MDTSNHSIVPEPMAVRLSLTWWPPPPDESLGTDRARELVAELRRVIGPVVAEAEADLRARLNHAVAIDRYAEPAERLATRSLSAEMTALCLGIVYPHKVSGQSNSIELCRDGTVSWRSWSRRP